MVFSKNSFQRSGNPTIGSILWTIRADAYLYKRIGAHVSLPLMAAAQRLEVTVAKGRGGVTLTLTLILKDASSIDLIDH